MTYRRLILVLLALGCLLAFSGAVSACDSGPPSFNDHITADAGQYKAKSFNAKTGGEQEVSVDLNVTVYLLDNPQYSNFKDGKNYTTLWTKVDSGPQRTVDLESGKKYWLVLDNTDGASSINTKVSVSSTLLEDCSGEPASPIPGFGLGTGAFALIMVGLLNFALWRR